MFFLLLGLVMILSSVWIFKTEKRLKRFFLGKKAKDLEDTIISLEEDILILKGAKVDVEREISAMNVKLKKSIRGVETIRFNPFSDQGSNQSFAIGMLNEHGDGLVMSSLYSRDRMSVFAKPVKNGESEFELTREERDVLQKSKVQ